MAALKRLPSEECWVKPGGAKCHIYAPILPESEPGEAVREATMTLHVVEAVLKAADEWVSAQEALVTALQVSKETDAGQEAVDIAGSRLVVAVRRWRSRRRAH